METNEEIPDSWLETFNQRMGEEGVPHVRRPFLALMEWTRDRSCTILGGSRTEEKLFQWFYDRSPAGSHALRTMYEGVFYFDSAFWPMHVPRMYGVNLNVTMSDFIEMSEPVKDKLFLDAKATEEYKNVWSDCFDYSYSLDDIAFDGTPDPNKPFLAAAIQQLASTVSLLRELRPNDKAMESSRMALEMFLESPPQYQLWFQGCRSKKTWTQSGCRIERDSLACANIRVS